MLQTRFTTLAPSFLLASCVAAVLAACAPKDSTSTETRAALERGRELARIAQDSADSVARWAATMQPNPGDVIDSALSVDEQLRRFRADLDVAGPASALTGGAPTRDSLVRAFVAHLASADTAALSALLVTPAEFADLYYLASRYSAPPYQLSPQLLWMQFQLNSEKGLTRLLRRIAGRSLEYAGHECPGTPQPVGEGRVWEACTVATRENGATAETRQLFGGIFEYGGRFKFMGYANEM